MTDPPIDLDSHRGMAAQKETETRRHNTEVAADQAVLRHNQDELEQVLFAGAAADWVEAGRKMRYLIALFAATPEGQESRYRVLSAQVLEDIRRLSAQPPDGIGS